MKLQEIMDKLKELGTEQTQKTYLRHGAKEPLFGVKVGDLKKFVKEVKKDQQLVRALYDTGNSDAMYLAGLTVDPKSVTIEELRAWVLKANWYMLSEYTVAGVAAESPYARELALEWIGLGHPTAENIASCGWSTYSNYISITPDDRLDLEEIRRLLARIEVSIHEAPNRVRYTMNGFVISVGSYISALHEEAKATAGKIGLVSVNMGETACKVPEAVSYIDKVAAAGKLGVKRKTCIC